MGSIGFFELGKCNLKSKISGQLLEHLDSSARLHTSYAGVNETRSFSDIRNLLI